MYVSVKGWMRVEMIVDGGGCAFVRCTALLLADEGAGANPPLAMSHKCVSTCETFSTARNQLSLLTCIA